MASLGMLLHAELWLPPPCPLLDTCLPRSPEMHGVLRVCDPLFLGGLTQAAHEAFSWGGPAPNPNWLSSFAQLYRALMNLHVRDADEASTSGNVQRRELLTGYSRQAAIRRFRRAAQVHRKPGVSVAHVGKGLYLPCFACLCSQAV